MKIVLEIPNNKVTSLIDVLSSISYVKIQPFKDDKIVLKENIKEAIEELNLIRKGKLKGIPANQLLDEL